MLKVKCVGEGEISHFMWSVCASVKYLNNEILTGVVRLIDLKLEK